LGWLSLLRFEGYDASQAAFLNIDFNVTVLDLFEFTVLSHKIEVYLITSLSTKVTA
jgi:hypothetical protein